MVFFKNIISNYERERESKIKQTFSVPRVYIFDFIRVLACCLILFHHLFETDVIKGFFHFQETVAGIGMELFFFTTGFLIPLSLDNCSVRQFLVKRFFRLFPVLFVCTLIYFIAYKNCNYKHFFVSIFLLEDVYEYFAKQMPFHIGVAWSMLVEVKYYLICAFVFYIAKKDKIRLYLIFLLSLILYLVFFKSNNWFSICSTYIMGVVLGGIYYYFNKGIIKKIEFILLYLLTTILFLTRLYFNFEKSYVNFFHSYFVASVLALFIVHFFKNRGNNKFIKSCANLTYSVYLLHELFCIKIGFKIFNNFPINSLKDGFILLFHNLIFLSICLCFCYIIYKYIEEPFYRFGRKLASNLK